MNVAVAILDRDDWTENTDNLAVVDRATRTVVSIPRDLWCTTHGNRINRAFLLGGPQLLIEALAEHGYAVDAVVCLRRAAVERALEEVCVTVPVTRPLEFLYPLTPTRRLEDGAKLVRFEPPCETLLGERIHQWIGARKLPQGGGADIDRIPRQQLLVRCLLELGFDFSAFLRDPLCVSVSDERALAVLAEIRGDWRFEVHDAVRPRVIDGKKVLVPAHPLVARLWHLGRHQWDRLRGLPRFLLTARSRGWASGLASRSLAVPSGGRARDARSIRLIAILAVRNEREQLYTWFANVAPHVDGVVALDDGSTDGTAEMLEARPEVLELIRRPPDRPCWDEVGCHKALVAGALRQRADWILALDADERVERDFRSRAERVIRRGWLLGFEAYSLRLFELWSSPRTWRADGIWGRKRVVRLFRARADHFFDERPLHSVKAPVQARILGRYPPADLYLYHLRMIDPVDRRARRARYQRLDPDTRWQPEVGYAYLTDETGLRLRPVSRRRGFDD